MQILNRIEDIIKDVNSSVTIGTFDGLHLAHQAIIRKTIEEAKKTSGRSVAVTFDPHPRTVLDGINCPRLLITTKEKIELFEKLDLPVDILLIVDFTREFSKLSSVDFFKYDLFEKIGLNNLIIGYDHNFGRGRSGNAGFLKSLKSEYNFDLHIVDQIVHKEEKISSTNIRKLLLDGYIEDANSLLGWNYMLSGTIVEGNMRGRKIGFPTANLKPFESNKLIPKNGVYFVRTYIEDKIYYGFLNIGIRPTFGDTIDVFIETHIFDFNEDIYGKIMKIEFLNRIRDEIKFNSVEELVKQIKKDKEICLGILNNKNILSN